MYAADGCSRGSRLKRGLLIGLFSIGTIGGFASGMHSMRHHCQARRERFEDHVADVCVRAAHRAEAETEKSRAPSAETPNSDRAEK